MEGKQMSAETVKTAVPVGSVAGLEKAVTRVVLGTMIINAGEQERSNELLDGAVAAGITTFDTAHVYGGGNAERGLGAWMAARGNREDVVILSKGCHHNADRLRVTPFDLAADLHDSLAWLGTEYVDIYLLHRDDPHVPVGPLVEELNHWHAAGKIRAFGGSNWEHTRLEEANAYAEKHGLVGFTASSPNFGLAEQVENPWGEGCVSLAGEAQSAARAWHRKAGIAVFAYSSLARGLFSGRVTRENYGEVADGACQRAYCHEVNFARADRAAELAEERGVTMAQIALAWVLGQDLDVYALVGCASPGECEACARAASLDLSVDERTWLLEGGPKPF